ncbi:MAG: DsbA family protein [Elainellaceae cyanobacterium]
MTTLQRSSLAFPPLSDRDHVRGSLNATILLMEYGDFCSAQSGQAYVTVKALLQQLGDQICLVFRYFPQVEHHPQALKAAASAEAAASQNKFWEMHDLLFEHQAELEDWNLADFAVQLGLDFSQFLKELSSHQHLQRIEGDRQTGQRYGVQETPTFFVGIRYQGAHNLQELMVTILQAIQTYQ